MTKTRRSIKDSRTWLEQAKERRHQLFQDRSSVARGALLNRLRRRQRLIGFITDAEGPPKGPWFVKFECVNRDWIDEAFTELTNTDFDLRELVETGAVTPGLDLLHGFLGEQPFTTAFDAASQDARYCLGAVRRWFIDRSIGGPDGSQSLPSHSLFEASIDRSLINAPPAVGKWAELTLIPPSQPRAWDDAHGTLVSILEDEPYIGEPEPMQIQLLRIFEEPWQGLLQALHFPAPEGEEVELEAMDEDESYREAGVAARVASLARRLARRLRAWLNGVSQGMHEALGTGLEAVFGGGWQPQMALAGLGGRGGGSDEVPSMRVLAYVGSPKAHGGAAAGAANPMVAGGGQQAFVGLVDVGQGNCNIIVDSNWHIQAYYDFGHSVRGDGPDELPDLCFCHDPFIILSHWDQDHYMLHAKNPECYRARWIVPRQGGGTLGTCVTGKVKRAGGQVYVWAKAHPSHMAFPWGFVERCSGTGRNDSGLAVYVCCGDRAANPSAPGTAPWSTAGQPGWLVVEAPSTYATRARQAVAHTNGTVVARCLASALANSRFSSSLGHANCTTVADQAQANMVAQVAASGAPSPDPAAVEAAATLALGSVPAGTKRARAAKLTAVAAIAVDAAYVVAAGSENWAASCAFGLANQKPMATATITTALTTLGYATDAARTDRGSRVAAALKESRFGRHLTDQEAAEAACRAVEVVLGAGARSPAHGPLQAAAAAGGSLAALPNTATRRQRALKELTVAAIAGYMADCLGLPEDLVAHCVAGGFVPDNAAKTCWPQTVVGGLRPAPAAGEIPQVRNGAAPVHGDERFVLLTGDANFQMIPSCSAAQVPVVVGLEAMHHGSFIEGSEYLDGDHIPWAPGVAPTVAAHEAEQAKANRTVVVACVAALAASPPTPATVDAADHVAAAAASAVLAADAAGDGPEMLYDDRTANLIALAVAAAAYTASVGGGSQAVAASILIVFALTKTDPPPLPLGTVHTAAANLLTAAGLGPIAGEDVARETRGCVGTSGSHDYAASVAAGVAALLGCTDALTGANAGAAAQVAITSGMPAEFHAYAAIANRLANKAVVAVAAAPGVGNEAAAAGVGARAAEVTAALRHRPADAVNPQPDLATTLLRAARWAAEAVAAQAEGADPSVVHVAISSVLAGRAAQASAVRALPQADRIAYSYGVATDGKHSYRSLNLATYGHAHPPALDLYAAKGWTGRRNVCARAGLNAVPAGHLDQHDPLNPAGHAALAWDAANDQMVAAGTINYVCPDCGASITFNV